MSAAFPAARRITTNGIELAVHEAGPADGPAVVFCHGFPELAFSWRFQLPAVAAAGYRAIAPDQRGYGDSDRPGPVEAYDIQQLTGDLAGLLDALGIERAVFCGHDWGGAVVWSMAQLRPDRVAGVIALNTPFSPRASMDPLKLMKAGMGEDFYIVQFQQPGVADAIFAERVEAVFRMFYGRSEMTAEDFARLPADQRRLSMLAALEAYDPASAPAPIIDEEALSHFIDTFRKTGFTGGINWYRNISRNWAATADVPDHVGVPALMVSAANDVVLTPAMTEGMEQWVPDLEKHVIADCGHWTQQEKPDETNALILDWLQRRFPI
ncbi:MAG: alpha/beta hydrolase [Pseudomonadales bacterium]|jgi:pimeloyl-ACP methyl ester carboxylesterase|nr:alpha/beta hydrolase [Pseudomonadales bacterium]